MVQVEWRWVVILGRLIAILALVILGSVAAQELFKFLMSVLPLLTVVTICVALVYRWGRGRFRRF